MDQDEPRQQSADWNWIWITAYSTVFFGLFLLLVYCSICGYRDGDFCKKGITLLLGLASLSSGFVVGFLFGIPRVPRVVPGTDSGANHNLQARLTDDAMANAGKVNNNLIEISDWLCKIIVGLGLVEIRNIPGHFQSLAEFVALDLGATPNPSLAGAIIVYFVTVGFLFGYIATRTILTRLFDDVDHPSLDKAKKDMAAQAQAQLNREMRYQVAWTKGIIAQTKDMDQTFVDEAIDELGKVHLEVPERRKFAMTLSWLLANKPHGKEPASPAAAIQVMERTKAAMAKLPGYKKEDWAAIHFNLACFHQLLRQGLPEDRLEERKRLATQVYENLRVAIVNDPTIVADARTDEDLKQIQKETPFVDLMKQFEK